MNKETMSKKSFVTINKYAALLPCLFCGKRTNKLIHLEGCKERNYENVGFFICAQCENELLEALQMSTEGNEI